MDEKPERRSQYRRRIERRRPRLGVTIRHDDDEKQPPKRVRAGRRKDDGILDAEFIDADG